MGGTIREMLETQVAARPDAPFLFWGDTVQTYREFDAAANRAAHGLRGLGIGPGNKVSIVMGNCPEFLHALFGIAKLGAVVVPVNTALKADAAQYIIAHADARVLIAGPVQADVAQAVRPGCPALERVIVLGETVPAECDSFALLQAGDPAPPPGGPTPDDVAAILYTSGTTARPKGVLLLHRAYAYAARTRSAHLGLIADDRVMIVNPVFHVNGQVQACMTILAVGGSVVLKETFSASRFWDDTRWYGVTIVNVMRTIPLILWSRPPAPDDAQNPIRIMVGSLPADVHEPFEERFGVTVVSAYSLTEDMTSVLNVMDKRRRKIGALGVPVSPETHQVRVVDEEDRDVPPGTGGEILKRSPASMLGYYKNPEATAAALRGGWVHTGDVGYLSEDGFLYFLDRKKDIVRRSGENISSSEVEAVLHAHPGIAEAAVIPVPDPIREQEVIACIRLKDGEDQGTVRPEDVFSFCAARLAAYKVPRYLVYRDDFPRTASYKIQKEKLKADATALVTQTIDRTKPPARAH